MDRAFAERDAAVANLNAAVAKLDAAVADRDAAIGNLLKTAGLLKAKGFSDKDIAAITGLDFDTIGNLPDNS